MAVNGARVFYLMPFLTPTQNTQHFRVWVLRIDINHGLKDGMIEKTKK